MHLPRILLTTAYSDNRKTMLTAGISLALQQRGRKLSYFSCGTDYLAPRINARLLEIHSRILDTYFMSEEQIRYQLVSNTKYEDFVVMEGMQRFYDGVGYSSVASSYDLARVTDTPVILIVNASDFTVTNISMLKGLIDYKQGNNIRGIIFNKATKAIYRRWKDVIREELGITLLGFIPNVSDYLAPSMYILTDPDEVQETRKRLYDLASILNNCIDFDALIDLAESAPDFEYIEPDLPHLEKPVRVAVARDNAFRLYYEDNMDLLRAMGAETVLFSPLEDKELPENTAALILVGGHPEIYAETLSANRSMRESILKALKGGMPCLAFGGGFMYLCKTLLDYRKLPHEMVGFLDAQTFPADESEALGHMKLIAQKDTLLGKKGTVLLGHGYHSFESSLKGEDFLASTEGEDRWFPFGLGAGNLVAGFAHLYYASNPEASFRFLKAAESYLQGLQDLPAGE
ncbi:MAG: cobyrinate a,c-diamide synthase [Lachnospiraceae bacterium]|nr:cobyrinate a,c-diamide synthase [Lachnospiraceae bacterium]